MSQPHLSINEHDQRPKRSQSKLTSWITLLGRILEFERRQSQSAARSLLTGEQSAPARIIADQQPAYCRSVATSPASEQQPTLHFESALRRAAPGGPWPLPGAARPRLVGKAPPKARDRRRGGGRSTSESGLRRIWRVEHAGLPGRPDDFPLLRTSRLVSARANVISGRISDCLRSRSIKAKFSKSDDGNNVAECRNADFCKFTIGLYAAEDGGVLVEVHRLCGDCISFMKDCRAILNASEGKTELSPSEEKPSYLRLPVTSLPPVSPEEEGDRVGIAITTALLSSHRSDANMLGMESLVVQTDPLRSLNSTAETASRMILCPDDSGNKPFNVHSYVMSLLIYGEGDALSAPEDPVLASLEDHAFKLRNLAVSALSNALALFAAEGLLPTTVAPHREWYADVLVPALLRDLSASARRPFDACYASRCLSALAESSTEFADAMRDAGGREAATCAREVGAREFAMLARDAGSYRNVLMSCCA